MAKKGKKYVEALATSKVTVPELGFGIKPLGPNTLPNLPTTPIMSGVATTCLLYTSDAADEL